MWIDPTENDRVTLREPLNDAVREQLNRLLSSPFFRHSRRLPKFLSFVIEHTLGGDGDSIKERTLGVEIFGRNPDYETATDPIVRVTAAEIRKRVAQYYLEPGHEDELRITLPSGSYIPRFEWPGGVNDNGTHLEMGRSRVQDLEQTAGEPEIHSGAIPPSGEDVPSPTRLKAITKIHSGESESDSEAPVMRRRYLIPIVLVALLAAGLLSVGTVLLWRSIHRSPIDFFWGPILNTHEPVLICVSDQVQDNGIALRDTTDPSHSRWFLDSQKTNPFPTVSIDIVNVIVKLTPILQSGGGSYTLKGEGSTNLADLRAGPAVLVGAFNNAWTLRLTNSLRFRFANDPDMQAPRIVDGAAPTKLGWAIDQSRMGSSGSYRDYAIIARFTDSDTGKLAVIVAGIGRCGTLAAGQFLSDPSFLAEVERAARAAGGKRNMELVLSTEVIDSQPGSPKVEAAHFW